MTTTIDYKLILTGVFLTCLILYFAGTGTMTKPLPRVVGKTTNIQIIYRGIPLGHPGYESAKDGIARPVGGNSTPWMHRDGQTNSVYTSWTTNLSVAYQYATRGLYGTCDGIILVKKVDLNNDRITEIDKVPGGDLYNEYEILIKGMMNGAVPILVKTGMNNIDLHNLLKNAI